MVTEAPVSSKWQQAKGRRSGLCPLVPSAGGREGLSVLHAYLQWGGDSAQAPLPAGPWGPGRSAESCCVRAGWGASARPPGDPGKQAVGDKGSILGCRLSELVGSPIRLPGHRVSASPRHCAHLPCCSSAWAGLPSPGQQPSLTPESWSHIPLALLCSPDPQGCPRPCHPSQEACRTHVLPWC